jgi:hypothetical protein
LISTEGGLQIVHTIEVRVPPAGVFRWLTDGPRVRQWLSGLVENQTLNLPAGRVGATFRQVYQDRRRRISLIGAVTAFEPDRRLAVHTVGRGYELDVDYLLEPLGFETRLVHTSTVRLSGLMVLTSPWMLPRLRRKSLRQMQTDLERLKQLCEREHAIGVVNGVKP